MFQRQVRYLLTRDTSYLRISFVLSMICGMNVEGLYLLTIEDVERKLAEYSPYSLIRGAALLRQLLLDGGNSLVDRVNSMHIYRLKLRFSVQPPFFLPFDNFQIWNPSVRPVAGLPYIGRPPLMLDRDSFLDHKFVSGEGVLLDVKDIIKFCANVAGGVHLGNANTREEKLLLRMHQEIADEGNKSPSGVLVAIAGLVEVIVDGLKPLTDSVSARVSAETSDD